MSGHGGAHIPSLYDEEVTGKLSEQEFFEFAQQIESQKNEQGAAFFAAFVIGQGKKFYEEAEDLKKAYATLKKPLDPKNLVDNQEYLRIVKHYHNNVKQFEKIKSARQKKNYKDEYKEILEKTEKAVKFAELHNKQQIARAETSTIVYGTTLKHTYNLSEDELKKVLTLARTQIQGNPQLIMQDVLRHHAEEINIRKQKKDLGWFKSRKIEGDILIQLKKMGIDRKKLPQRYEAELRTRTITALGLDKNRLEFESLTKTPRLDEETRRVKIYQDSLQRVSNSLGIPITPQPENPISTPPTTTPEPIPLATVKPAEPDSTVVQQIQQSINLPVAPVQEQTSSSAGSKIERRIFGSANKVTPFSSGTALPSPLAGRINLPFFKGFAEKLNSLAGPASNLMKGALESFGGLAKNLVSKITILAKYIPSPIAGIVRVAGIVLNALKILGIDGGKLFGTGVKVAGGIVLGVIFIVVLPLISGGNFFPYYGSDSKQIAESTKAPDLSWNSFFNKNLTLRKENKNDLQQTMSWNEFQTLYLSEGKEYLSLKQK
jgi:hypothetical protein